MSTQLDVLIIDDETDFAFLVKEVAEGAGLQAAVAADPDAFRELFKTRLPTTVVLDLFMPEMNGFELAEWMGEIIRANNLLCRLVIVSGFGDEHIRMCRTVASLAGIEDIVALRKPVEVVALERAFRRKGR